MADLLAYLPPFEGLLPKWLFLVSVISSANSIQAYRSDAYSAELYNGRSKPDGHPFTNPLSSRTFATWTFLSGVIRMYAAYNITNSVSYDLAAWSFGIALFHFLGEWVSGTAQLKGRFVSPMIVASSTLTWMVTQREWYLA
ncbi:Erg28 family protein [Aspergillus candidus]|uniref:Putative ergosterol biosynthesis protein Erg28 n=1 Tax=Aspergillus candidus TaxID=41067 RepID=A0A2I2F9E4_ASPCN|nr:putative ergosterol biosynthesis protein Erg28 [Aspergillus candidus]PLB37250.1 putative ergosterol biosynthesis protein Erg28 [Aspergillus candidus]